MQSIDPFKNAEEAYLRLRGQLAAGRITRAQFDAALRELMIQDAQGRYWAFGESGKWFVYDGRSWVEADPYAAIARPLPQPAAVPSAPPAQIYVVPVPTPIQVVSPVQGATAQKKGGGCCGCLITGLVVAIVLLVIVGVGGYLAYQSGAITSATLLNLVGLGPGDVEVDNFRDDAVHVTVTQLDVSPDSTPARRALEIKSFDIQAFRVQNPGRYRVEFGTTDGGADLGACTLRIRSGDQYQFVALPTNIVVNRANNPSATGADFVIATSALCR